MDLITPWYLLWGIPWAIAVGLDAQTRSRNPIVWGILGFFFSFVAVIALWFMGDGDWGETS